MDFIMVFNFSMSEKCNSTHRFFAFFEFAQFIIPYLIASIFCHTIFFDKMATYKKAPEKSGAFFIPVLLLRFSRLLVWQIRNFSGFLSHDDKVHFAQISPKLLFKF